MSLKDSGMMDTNGSLMVNPRVEAALKVTTACLKLVLENSKEFVIQWLEVVACVWGEHLHDNFVLC